MEDVDYPRAWLRLKAYIGRERGHGADDLLAEMSRIEVETSESHRDAQMARKGSTSSTSDRPPRDRAATASRTREPRDDKPTTPGGARNGNGHRAPEPVGR